MFGKVPSPPLMRRRPPPDAAARAAAAAADALAGARVARTLPSRTSPPPPRRRGGDEQPWGCRCGTRQRAFRTEHPERMLDKQCADVARPATRARPRAASRRGRPPLRPDGAPLARQRDALARWLWACKENVNRKLYKPHVPYPPTRGTHFRSLTSDAALLDLACTLVLYAPAWPRPRKRGRRRRWVVVAPPVRTVRAGGGGEGAVFEEALCDRLCEVARADGQGREATLDRLRRVARWFYGDADE